MEEIKEKLIPVAIEDEMKVSYLNYAMSVIVSRALPDIRDGLKPVHRRILYSMSEMGLRADRSFKKCGRIVGDVLGKFHPHGDQSIYDALVRMAQGFSMRYEVVNGQGNFGSVDGDPPAAMRYTEAKMHRLAEEMIRDIKKDTVDFRANYDDSMKEPEVLPAAVPYLLVNGASGIAVGMATNIAPHNLKEVCAAVIALIDNPEISTDELMEHITGPDFPLGGIIYGRAGIVKAYKTGKGKIPVRAKVNLEITRSGKDVIIVTEIPYMVNKSNLMVSIENLRRDKKIEGISELRDESDRKGIRIVMELKRGTTPRVVLNLLFNHTSLQQNFNINNLAIVNGRPKLLTLKDMLYYFIKHRKEVVIRRTKFELKKAEERAHILEGLKIALENIDEVIALIKKAKNVDEARRGLILKFSLSEKQAQAILDMRLQKLTGLETQKILDELKELMLLIEKLKELLGNENKILNVVKEETIEISNKYGDERRTEIVYEEIEEMNIEDMIKKEDMVVLISSKGFIKRIPVSSYKNQGRGGRGSNSAKLKNEDFLEHLFVASTHDILLFITSAGKAFWLKVHEIPEATRAARGYQLKGLIAITPDEEITGVVAIKNFTDEKYLFMVTCKGIAKKVAIAAFKRAKRRGIIAIKLDQNDVLACAMLTEGQDEGIIVTRSGNALRFNEENVRAMGRATRGVRGIRLRNTDEVIGLLTITENEQMFLISEFGYGKRIEYEKFTQHNRGTKGQIAYRTSDKTGELIGALSVKEEDYLVCITSQGKTIKLKLNEIPVLGKSAFGVRIVRIEKPDFLIGVARVVKEEAGDEQKP